MSNEGGANYQNRSEIEKTPEERLGFLFIMCDDILSGKYIYADVEVSELKGFLSGGKGITLDKETAARAEGYLTSIARAEVKNCIEAAKEAYGSSTADAGDFWTAEAGRSLSKYVSEGAIGPADAIAFEATISELDQSRAR